jgi:dTDP-4-amino-4,6-dideoxygalactose transaminase
LSANKVRIPLLDLERQYSSIRTEIEHAAVGVLRSQRYILGEDVALLEREMADYCQTKYAIGCASGSDALRLGLMALGAGPGDEVVTTPFTFFATASAITLCGAKPVFADIDRASYNLDAGAVAGALAQSGRVKAVIAVDLYGACAEMDEIGRVAARHGVAVIEDAAQAIGAELHGRRAGSLATAGCFSFFPTKNLGGCGDGGMVTTSNWELAEELRMLRVHGSRERYRHERIGLNSRLDSLQAAVLRVKLRHLNRWTEQRQRNAALYAEGLKGLPVTLPSARQSGRHVYNQYVIGCPDRDELRAYLTDRGIGTEIYYPIPLHLQPCFAYLGYRAGDFPVAESCARSVLALPIYPELPADDLEAVCEAIRLFYTGHR